MTWNLPKIREACLRLMGWTPSSYTKGASTYTHWHADETVKLDRPDSTQFPPDPTASLDDALPLMVEYGMTLDFGNRSQAWSAWDEDRSVQIVADTAPLAVCLCALRCAGHNLKDYEQ